MDAFRPIDDATVSMTVSASSGRVSIGVGGPSRTARIANIGDEWIYVRFGGADVVADQDDIPIPPNWVDYFGVGDATHCAAVTDSSPGANTLRVTPGEGE